MHRWLMLILSLSCGAAAAELQTGPDWIANQEFRVGLENNPRNPDAPFLNGQLRVGGIWKDVFSWGGFSADFTGPDAVARRQRYGSPFQPWEPGMPAYKIAMENIKTGVAEDEGFLSFRLRRDDLWMDIRIRLLPDAPLAIFEATGASSGLQPRCVLYPRVFFTALVYAPATMPARPVERSGREFEDGIFRIPARYAVVFRPAAADHLIFSWPDDASQPRQLWPNIGQQPLPFGLYAGHEEKDLQAMGHLGEGVRAMFMNNQHSDNGGKR